MLECGARFEDEDFAEKTSDAKRYYWMPYLGMKGILRLTLFKDIFIASGCGVGGGSLGYANTLYRALPGFYTNPQWSELADWESRAGAALRQAERMLGVTDVRRRGAGRPAAEGVRRALGVGDTYRQTRVGVFFGEPGQDRAGPVLRRRGARPDAAASRCGSCMVGCRHGAKNTLMKNYLWFAERPGVEIQPERTVIDIGPLGERRRTATR